MCGSIKLPITKKHSTGLRGITSSQILCGIRFLRKVCYTMAYLQTCGEIPIDSCFETYAMFKAYRDLQQRLCEKMLELDSLKVAMDQRNKEIDQLRQETNDVTQHLIQKNMEVWELKADLLDFYSHDEVEVDTAKTMSFERLKKPSLCFVVKRHIESAE